MASKPDASKLTYNKESIREGMKRPSLDDGLYAFLTSTPKTDVIPKGDYAGSLTLGVMASALKDPKDPTTKIKPAQRDGCVLPIDNPAWPGHTAPSWAWGLSGQFFMACFSDGEKVKIGGKSLQFFHSPKWEDGDLFYKGKKQKSEDDDALRDEYGEIIAQFSIALYGDPSCLKDRFYYGQVGKRKESDKFKNIIDRWAELPEGQKLASIEDKIKTSPNRRPTTGRRKRKGKK